MRDLLPYFSIQTPATAPDTYAPDWRHLAAVYALRHGRGNLPLEVAADPAVQHHISTLRLFRSGTRLPRHARTGLWPALDAIRRAEAGEATEGRQLMHALLLSDTPYAAISEYTGVSEYGVRYYELMYYNCRTTDGAGHLLPPAARIPWANSGRIRVTAEDPQSHVWAYVAIGHGWTGIQALLGLPGAQQAYANTLFKSGIMTTLAGRMIVGAGKNFDMAALWKTANDGDKVTQENKRDVRGRGYAVLLEFLSLLKPEMYTYEQRVNALSGGAVGAVSKAAVSAAIDTTAVETASGALAHEAEANARIRSKMQAASKFAKQGAGA